MGYFQGAIEPNSDNTYDVCPVCGDLMQIYSKTCVGCQARQMRQEQAAKLEAEEAPARKKRDEFYQNKVAEGWTYADVAAHTEQQRIERGDPPRPRFRGKYTISD